MASDSLDNSVYSDQSKDKTFTLRFSQPQWMQFWRLMIVGSCLAEQVLDMAERSKTINPHLGKSWNELSYELLPVLTSESVS